MIRIAICDDDMDFLDDFSRRIHTAFVEAGQDVAVTAFSSGKQLIEAIEKQKSIFDILFLDVEMPQPNGFQVAQRLREQRSTTLLIFTTYMEHQSREGYHYGAFRYVFKNNLATEINEAVESVLKKFNDETVDQEQMIFRYRNAGVLENVMIQKEDILFLEKKKDRRVLLHTTYGEYELLTSPLSAYAERLTPPMFAPIMRNFIVNFHHVQGIGTDTFLLTGGISVPLGINREVQRASEKNILSF